MGINLSWVWRRNTFLSWGIKKRKNILARKDRIEKNRVRKRRSIE